MGKAGSPVGVSGEMIIKQTQSCTAGTDSLNLSEEKRPSDRTFINSWVLVSDFEQYLVPLREKFPEISTSMKSAVGYIYNDPDCGISLKIEYLCTVESPSDTINSFQILGDIFSLKFRYSSLNLLNISRLSDEQITSLGFPPVPDWLEFYETHDLRIIRELEWLDPLRNPGFFNDVMGILPHEGEQVPEFVWIRLTTYSPETRRFQGKLLNEPFHESGIHRNDIIEVECSGTSLICVMQKNPQENETDAENLTKTPG
ncbi:MAG: hypothetical protein M0Q91_10215 [Methanoregula sp.]|jgi:hypothetical protein|nr:hypothetical protein [Methanoregula sp.]